MRKKKNTWNIGMSRLGIALAIEAFLFCVPFLASISERRWHWVDDQGPSFLVYLLLGYGAWALMVVVAIAYLWQLSKRMLRKRLALEFR